MRSDKKKLVKGWIETTLGERINLEYGKSPNKVKDKKGKYPLMGSSGISGRSKDYTTCSPAIILGRKGTIDKPIYSETPCWAIDTTYFVDKFPKDESKYIFYLLSSQNLKSLNESTGVPSLSRDAIHSLKVSLPPLPEQKKIAEILSCIDKSISLLDLKISKLQILFNGQRQEFFKGRTNWDEYKISDIADPTTKYSLTGGPFGSDLKVSDYTSNGIRVIQLQNIGDSIFYDKNKIFTSLEKADSLLSSNIFAGDLIIAKMGDPVAKCTVIPNYIPRGLMSSDGIRLKVKQDSFDNYFIQLSINSSYFRKKTNEISTGTTRQRIGLQEFRKLTISCPSIKEQKKISRTLLSIQKSINCLKKEQLAIKKLKRGVSSNLLFGYTRVNV